MANPNIALDLLMDWGKEILSPCLFILCSKALSILLFKVEALVFFFQLKMSQSDSFVMEISKKKLVGEALNQAPYWAILASCNLVTLGPLIQSI